MLLNLYWNFYLHIQFLLENILYSQSCENPTHIRKSYKIKYPTIDIARKNRNHHSINSHGAGRFCVAGEGVF